MFYKEIKEQTGSGSTFLEHLEAQILKVFPRDANHCGGFMGSFYVPICPKNSGYITGKTLNFTI